jgi:hypothetical protein
MSPPASHHPDHREAGLSMSACSFLFFPLSFNFPNYAWTFWLALLVTSWGAAPDYWKEKTETEIFFGKKEITPPVLKSERPEELACNDTINVPLDEYCQARITPDMVLDGETGCLTDGDFELVIDDWDPSNGAVLDGFGVFRYQISKKDDASCEHPFESCWGYIRGDDKTPPEVECPEHTSKARVERNVQLLTGSLHGNNQIRRDLLSCFDDPPIEDGDHFYDLRRFKVAEKGIYTFEIKTDAGTPMAGIYQREFNPHAPCKRLLKIAGESDGEVGFFQDGIITYRFEIELLPDREYLLFTSLREAELPSDYRWAIFSLAREGVVGVPGWPKEVRLPLRCVNVDSVLYMPASTDWLGEAKGQENCGPAQNLGFEDVLQITPACESQVIARFFSFRDASGNTGSCIQRITFPQPDFSDVVLPPPRAYVNCDEDIMLDENGDPHPMEVGRPFLQTAFGPVFLEDVVCNLGARYEDLSLKKQCGDTRIILRKWTLIDWCRGGGNLVFNQEIIMGDFAGPQFDCPAPPPGQDQLTFSTSPFSCLAAFEVPLPDITDNCSETWEMEIIILDDTGKERAFLPAGTTNYFVGGLETGSYTLRYIVTDECGNTTVRNCEFVVVDGVDPVAICNDELNLSIGGDGRGQTTAEEVDEGSWDNCDPEPGLEIRRMVPEACLEAYRAEVDDNLILDEKTGQYYTPWQDEVDVICCEVGTHVRIELRVTDEGLLSNTCRLEVLVEDKIAPWCLPPADLDIPCDSLAYIDERDTLDLQAHFGKATAEDNCEAVAVELEPRLEIDNCGTGVLYRRFIAIDTYGNESDTCVQRINLTSRNHYEIKFPKDALNFSCGETDIDSLELRELACDLLAVSSDTTFLEAEDDACYKMFIEYKVINWCEYANGEPPVRIGRDEDGDGVPGDEAVYVLRRPLHPDSTYIDRDDNERNGFFRTATSVGFWEYTQMIKVYDDEPPDIVTPDFQTYFCAVEECTAEVDLLFEVFDNCGNARDIDYQLEYDENDDGNRQDLDVSLYIKGRFPKQRISGDFPIGKHTFYFTITDGCGNITAKRIPFEVVDCGPPAPECIHRLAAELQPMDRDRDGRVDFGANTIWATDFIAGETADCSGIRYSINRVGEMPNPDSTSITVTCDDPEELHVEIYLWDNADNPEALQPDGSVGGPNSDFCPAIIYVQDNMFNLCGRVPGATIAGLITTEDQQAVEEVAVHLSGHANSLAMTGADGGYRFGGIFEGNDYTILPRKDDDLLNGVSTYDLLLISKHILGLKNLDSPFKLLAADVNRSGSVTTLDLIQIRKVVLGTVTGLSNNTSWRFVRADYTFPKPDNPWIASFPELVNINNLTVDDLIPYNFVAVKVGDVNGSAALNSQASVTPRSRYGRMILQTQDRTVFPGDRVTASFYAENLEEVQGFQYTLDFNKEALQLLEIKYGLLGEANFGKAFLPEGILTTSWHFGDGEKKFTEFQQGAKPQLFQLTFSASEKGNLSDFLWMSSRVTPAEAYGPAGRLLDVELGFERHSPADFSLLQNQPNPFHSETVIGFSLPEAGPATLTITDVKGRQLYQRKEEFPAGNNEWIVRSAELPEPGLLFYQVQTEHGVQTRKMIRLR